MTRNEAILYVTDIGTSFTLYDLAELTRYAEASVSAGLRELRHQGAMDYTKKTTRDPDGRLHVTYQRTA